MVVTSFDHQCEGTGAVSPLLSPPSGIVHDCGLGLDSHGFVFSFSASPHEFELPVVVRTVCWHVTLLKSKCNNDIFYKFLFHFLQVPFLNLFSPLDEIMCQILDAIPSRGSMPRSGAHRFLSLADPTSRRLVRATS